MHILHAALGALQVSAVVGVQVAFCQHLRQLRRVLALKHIAQHRRLAPFGQILAHRVDEKQTQRLDTAFEQRLFALKVVGNGGADDELLHLIGQHAIVSRLAQQHRKAVGKPQLLRRHRLHHMAAQVAQRRFLAQVVAFGQLHTGRFAIGPLVGQVRHAGAGRAAHPVQHQRMHGGLPGAHRVHRDALDQALAKRLHAVQRVHQVFVFLVLEGGTKPKGQQRIELGQILLGFFALRAVRLVNDEHRAQGGQPFHVAFGLAKKVGLYAPFVDDVLLLVERAKRCHQHADARIGRIHKPGHRAFGVVEHIDLLVVVLACKKRRRGLQTLERALANGVGGHQHDEFGQPVALVQPVHRFDERERLARACFHQHIQVQCGCCGVGHRHRARRHLVISTDAAQVGLDGVARARGHPGGVGVAGGGGHKGHVVKHPGNAVHRLGLVFEPGVLKLG